MKNESAETSMEAKSKRFKITKGIDLINKVKDEPEPKIIWNGIVEGSRGLIAGVAKTGKTTLAENLAISIAVGKDEFFGHKLSGIPEKVLFINMEESYRLRSRRNMKQISILNENQKVLFEENYISTPEDFPEFLVTEDDWAMVGNYINESEANVIFIDSLSHMFSGQIENSEPAVKFVKSFRHHITSLKKTIVIVHHNTKGNDKPIDQDSIAGSRIIAQEFEYALGLGNIPTQKGGSYQCMLFNKYIEKDDTAAFLYRVNENNWIENLGKANKYDLYENVKRDYRNDTSNKDLLLKYIESQYSQGSHTTLTGTLKKVFVENSTMSKDTLHKNLDKLISEGKIDQVNKGMYTLRNQIKSE